MDVIGTSPGTATVEPSQEQRSRIESGTEIESAENTEKINLCALYVLCG
jgi:hypothetical protein